MPGTKPARLAARANPLPTHSRSSAVIIFSTIFVRSAQYRLWARVLLVRWEHAVSRGANMPTQLQGLNLPLPLKAAHIRPIGGKLKPFGGVLLSYSNSEETDVSSEILRTASPSNCAMGIEWMLCAKRMASVAAIESVTDRCSSADAVTRATAPPDRTP